MKYLFSALVAVITAACSFQSQAQSTVSLSTAACKQVTGYLCLEVVSGTSSQEFLISSNTTAYAQQIGTIGNFFSTGSLPAAYVYFTINNPNGPSAYLSIFDLNGVGLVAQAFAPGPNSAQNFAGYTIHNTWFGMIHDPQGRLYPFLAPGQAYLSSPYWNTLYLFNPSCINSTTSPCNNGFITYSADFTNSVNLAGFRHNGGWIQDVNGDGWDDINLPFLHGYILTIEGENGNQLSLTQVAPAQTDPYYFPYVGGYDPSFDSGRLYGSYTLFQSVDGHTDVMLAAGDVVGTFTNSYCNVSRYMAVLRESQASPLPSSNLFYLLWTDYISFYRTVYLNPLPPNNWSVTLSRPGDYLNKCVHRISNSVFHAGTRPITVFNVFTENPLIVPDACEYLDVQIFLNGLTSTLATESLNCLNNNVNNITGSWSVQALDLLTGKNVASFPNAYVWDVVKNLIPGWNEVYLLEALPKSITFSQAGYIPQAIYAFGIDSNYIWHNLGILPVAFRPNLQPSTPWQIPIGIGFGATYEDIFSTVTRQRSDGLVDIQLNNPITNTSVWVGWNSASGKLVVEPN
jgi:hypothetical protein